MWFRRALWLWRASRAWAAAHLAWLMMAGSTIGTQSSGGVARGLTPGATGRRADLRCRAGTGCLVPRWARPVETGGRTIPRTRATCHRGWPMGVGRCAALQRFATWSSVRGGGGAVSHAHSGVPTAAVTGSSRRRRGSRGPSGSSREPEGGTVPGSSSPRRLVVGRPRRRRSAIRVRSDSATAPRIGRKRGAWGASPMGRSSNSTAHPRGVRSSSRSM